LFSRILSGEIPGETVFENEKVFAIRDINPVAPTHILIIPKTEIVGLSSLTAEGDHLSILNAAKEIAQQEGLTDGFRLVINDGADAGQTVPHLHAHLIGGRALSWPPG
ncbi:MAG: HIT domain-containing protein, partial [Armatimonadota bacterium]